MKKKEKWLMETTLVLCVLLFAQRLTGEILHAVFGLVLAAIVGVHLRNQGKKMKHRNAVIVAVDWVLIISLAVLLLTGILFHPLHGILAVKILHKLAAVFFVLAVIGHGVQHIRVKTK